MSAYQDFLAEDRRLVILRILHEQLSFELNDSVLWAALERFAHVVARDVLRADLAWLEEQGLITTSTVADRVSIARLTERGDDVAAGRARHPGVKRPAPR